MAKQKFDIKNLSLGAKKTEDVEKVVQEIAKSSSSTAVKKPVAEQKKVEEAIVEEPKAPAKSKVKAKPKPAKTTRKKREPKVYAHSLLSEDTRRFTMDIPRKLYMKIKINAAEQDMTMKELVLEAVRDMYDK